MNDQKIIQIFPELYIIKTEYLTQTIIQKFDQIIFLNDNIQGFNHKNILYIESLDFNLFNSHINDAIANNKKLLLCDHTLDNPVLIAAVFIQNNILHSHSYTIHWLYNKLKKTRIFTNSFIQQLFTQFKQ
jgi:hypothetical protein